MNYGPSFQGLNTISAHPARTSAVAHMTNAAIAEDSVYQLHPSTIDACIQLFTTAACKGQAKAFPNVPYVPTSIGEVYLRHPSTNIVARVDASFASKGSISGTCTGTSDGALVVLLKDLKLSPLGDASMAHGPDPHAGVSLKWLPDASLQPMSCIANVRTSAAALCDGWLRILCHKRPHMRVLAIGSRTLLHTPGDVAALTSEFGQKMFDSYTVVIDGPPADVDRATSDYIDVKGVVIKPAATMQESNDVVSDLQSMDLIIVSEVCQLPQPAKKYDAISLLTIDITDLHHCG
jgi:hypothetical protein